MAVVAQEARVVVVLLDVVGDDVVVPIGVPFGHDALSEVGERDVGIAAHAPIGDHSVVPVVTALNGVVCEGIGRSDREEVAYAGIVVDREGVVGRAAVDLEVPAAAREVVVPRFAREQYAHATVGVDAKHGDEGVAIELEVDPDALAAGIYGGFAPVGP